MKTIQNHSIFNRIDFKKDYLLQAPFILTFENNSLKINRNIILIIMSAFGKLELENYFNNSVVWFRAQRTLCQMNDIDDFSVTRLVINISNCRHFAEP